VLIAGKSKAKSPHDSDVINVVMQSHEDAQWYAFAASSVWVTNDAVSIVFTIPLRHTASTIAQSCAVRVSIVEQTVQGVHSQKLNSQMIPMSPT
jgi:hypothetical protein